MGFIDLTRAPMVFETPPDALGTLDDDWWRWVINFGAPGPDRGQDGNTCFYHPTTTVRCREAAITWRAPSVESF